jgi:hypothetical protein
MFHAADPADEPRKQASWDGIRQPEVQRLMACQPSQQGLGAWHGHPDVMVGV